MCIERMMKNTSDDVIGWSLILLFVTVTGCFLLLWSTFKMLLSILKLLGLTTFKMCSKLAIFCSNKVRNYIKSINK